MNTTRRGIRTALAAAAAGALVLGSAGGAGAHPHKSDKAKGPKAAVSAEETKSKLANVNIKRHRKIDLADVDADTKLRLRAKVRYMKKVNADVPESVPMVLAVYDKKVNGEMLADSASEATDLALKERKRARKNQFYAGAAVIADVWTGDQIAALASAVAADGKAYICISSVDGEYDRFSRQTRKRLGVKADGSPISGKVVRDCVKVVNTSDADEA